MNYRVTKSSGGQSLLESVEQRGPVPAISVQLPTEAACEIVNAVTIYHKLNNKTAAEEVAETIRDVNLLDAHDTQRLLESMAGHFNQNKDVINNMDAEAISLALRTAATLVKHRIGE